MLGRIAGIWMIGMAVLALGMGGGSLAQSQDPMLPDLGLPINDPDDILAVCGGDPAAGQANFALSCAGCHTLTEGGAHGTGPNLYALYGRTAGTAPGFAYSAAMQSAGASGLVWDRETLRAFLKDPVGTVPGNSKASMPQMSDEVYRTDLMTYVRLTTTPPPPAPEDVVVPPELLAMEGDIAYGEYLAAECASCHVRGGQSTAGVPRIDLLPRDYMLLSLVQYRTGARPNATMGNIAMRLTDEEIAALAAYFADQKE